MTNDPYVRAWNRLADRGEISGGGFDPKNDPDDRRKVWLLILGIVAFVLMFVVFGSCSRKVYVPVERTTTVVERWTDTLVEVRIEEVHDTALIVSAFEDTTSYLSNGIAYSYASLQEGKFGHSLGILPDATVDALVKIKEVHVIDSIPYPVMVEVEKKLTFWEKMKMDFGGLAIAMFVVLLLVNIVCLLHEKHKRD